MSGVSAEAKFQERDLLIASEFASNHEDTFDSTFVRSLEQFFQKNNYLTDKQYTALQKIMESWYMEEWYDAQSGA